MNKSIYQNHEMKGHISVQLANGQSLDDFCAEYIPEYSSERFEAFAVRIFLGQETVITLFAVDKIRRESHAADETRLPVKKFKLPEMPLTSILSYFQGFNCTLSNGAYELEGMEVINK